MKKISLVFIIFILVQIACSSSGGASEGEIQTAIASTQAAIPTEAATVVPTTEPIATTAPTETVSQQAKLDKIRSATVQIEAIGQFYRSRVGKSIQCCRPRDGSDYRSFRHRRDQ